MEIYFNTIYKWIGIFTIPKRRLFVIFKYFSEIFQKKKICRGVANDMNNCLLK